MNSKLSILKNREQVITFAILLAICITSFIPANTFTSPAIASDDWSLIVEPYTFDRLKPLNLLNHRPIDLSFYYVLTSAFGLRFKYYYLLNALIIFLSALMYYVLIKRSFPHLAWIASLASIVYLIYPVDYTRTWVMMLYIRFWWLITLGSIWLIFDFAEAGTKWKMALALIGIIVPLGAYEGQFGVVATASFMIALVSKDKPIFRRLALAGSILFIGVLFYQWRFHIQANIIDVRYYSVGSFQFNLVVIIQRYFEGFNIFFSRWIDPIKAHLGLSGFQIFTFLVLYVIVCFFVTLLVFNKNTSPAKLSFRQKTPLLKKQFVLFLTGGVFWVAGYFPIIGLYPPSLNGHASRVNSFATAGAAMMLTALFVIFSTLLARSRSQTQPFAITIILPFIVAGIFIQTQVKMQNQAIWDTQKDIWNGTFETIPNIRDDKSVVIIIPKNEQTEASSVYPFSTAWEVDSGAKVLYNNPSINGYYYYKDSDYQQFEFAKNGITPQGTDRLVGYKRLIFVIYHPGDDTVALVENLEEALSLPFSVNNYTPHENIVPAQPSTGKFRWLVQ